MIYEFDAYVLDIDRRELRRAGQLLAIEPQVFDLLAYLVRHRDRVVTKDEILDSVWRGRIVSESTLTSRINSARGAIGDNGKVQRLIKTLRHKGLRFVGAVREPLGCERTGDLGHWRARGLTALAVRTSLRLWSCRLRTSARRPATTTLPTVWSRR